MSEIAAITRIARQAVETAKDITDLEVIRVQYLGKKGELTTLLRGLGKLPDSDRPSAGAAINKSKGLIELSLIHI